MTQVEEQAVGTLTQPKPAIGHPTVLPGSKPPGSKLTTGRVIGGRYELRAAIGAGGMGTVWSGHDQLLRRDVAIKEVLIHDGLPQRERDLLCERTLREARAAARLDHSSVIRVYDVVNEEDRPWIVMELLDARSLADVIKEDGALSVERVAEIGLAVLSALEAAHRLGILHRDVKPGNVLLCSNGRIVLTDFGVARSPDETPLTSTGLLLGSPQYIAPERARGKLFGPPSDLFSLGATLYAGVEARPPFDRGDPIPTMTAVVCEPPDAMPRAGQLEESLIGLLEKDPEQRWDAKRTKLALRAIVRSARRASAHSADDTAALRRLRRGAARKVAESDDVGAGRHRRGDAKIFTALAKPIRSAAEATAGIVVSRGRHTKRSRPPVPTLHANPVPPPRAMPAPVPVPEPPTAAHLTTEPPPPPRMISRTRRRAPERITGATWLAIGVVIVAVTLLTLAIALG